VALAALVLALASGCTTTRTVTPAGDSRDERAAVEAGDPVRRARVHLELASLYFGRGQGDTALGEVDLALAAKPDLAEAHALRALVRASMGDVGLAEESFRRALQLAPRDGGTIHNYAWFLCQQRRYSEADAHFESALTQPQYRDLVRTLLAQGVCQARAGHWNEAERTLSRSYELDPANPVTAFNLGEVLLHRGELERARFYVGRINAVPEQVTAQSLWLAARIERRLGSNGAVQELGRQLRQRWPQAAETTQFENGRFDD
jgi:type IV pilus assembly protein PilF